MAYQSYGIGQRLSNRAQGVYTLPVAQVLLAVILGLLVPSLGFASGSGEKEAAPALAEVRFRTFVLAEADNEGNRMFTERVSLPEAVSLTRWTAFSRRGSEVKMESSARLALREKRMTEEERASGVLVQGFDMVVSGPMEQKGGHAATPIEVRFAVKDCLNRQGKVLYQPARMAVIRGVLQSGRLSGEARLVEISHAAPGRFTAVVELR